MLEEESGGPLRARIHDRAEHFRLSVLQQWTKENLGADWLTEGEI